MKLLRLILQIASAISLVAMLSIIGGFAWSIYSPHHGESTETASPRDVQFILNWGGISEKENYSVVYSFDSGPSFNGDHVTYHCIQLSGYSINDDTKEKWMFGPERDPVIADAIVAAATTGEIHRCFSKGAEANTSRVMAFVSSLHLLGRTGIEGLDVILLDPTTRRLLYVSYET